MPVRLKKRISCVFKVMDVFFI